MSADAFGDTAPSVSCVLYHSPLALLLTFKSELVTDQLLAFALWALLNSHHLRARQASVFTRGWQVVDGLPLGQVSTIGPFGDSSAHWPGGVAASKG